MTENILDHFVCPVCISALLFSISGFCLQQFQIFYKMNSLQTQEGGKLTGLRSVQRLKVLCLRTHTHTHIWPWELHDLIARAHLCVLCLCFLCFFFFSECVWECLARLALSLLSEHELSRFLFFFSFLAFFSYGREK